jgi:hypothetical protein
LNPYIVGVQYVTFFPVVIITTLISGLGAGLFSLVLSVATAALFVASRRLSTFCNVILIAGMCFAIERRRELSQKLKKNAAVLHERLEQYGPALRQSEERLEVARRSPASHAEPH